MEYHKAIERLRILADVGEVRAQRLLAMVTGNVNQNPDLKVYAGTEIPIATKVYLPHGEALRRMLQRFAIDGRPQTCRQLATATDINYGTVHWALRNSGRFERSADNRMLWKLRATQGIPIRASESA